MPATSTIIGHRLGEVEQFAGLSRSGLACVDRLGVAVQLEVGRQLWRAGAPWREGVLLLSGRAIATPRDGSLATFGPGSFLDVRPQSRHGVRCHPATVRVIEPASAVVYTPSECHALLDELATAQARPDRRPVRGRLQHRAGSRWARLGRP
jgi:hypothetical protein